MTHHFVLGKSTKDVYEQLEAHMTKCNNSNALGNKYDIIPSNLITKITFLHSAQKFKECKEFFKSLILSPEFNFQNLKEVVFDGSINDLSAIYESSIETSIESSIESGDSVVFWVLRIPMNTLITSYTGDKHRPIHKSCYTVHFRSRTSQNLGSEIFIGATSSFLSACRLVEESSGSDIITPELSTRNGTSGNKVIEIPTSLGIYKIKSL